MPSWSELGFIAPTLLSLVAIIYGFDPSFVLKIYLHMLIFFTVVFVFLQVYQHNKDALLQSAVTMLMISIKVIHVVNAKWRQDKTIVIQAVSSDKCHA